MYTIFHMVMN